MIVDSNNLLGELERACADAGLDPTSFVVFVVDQPRPDGTTPMAYLQPAGVVLPDTVSVFRMAGAERAGRYRLRSHRLAVWREMPGYPQHALGPMLRHELEHARRWERSGVSFFEADDLLRSAVRRTGGEGYGAIPSEREANDASARYARAALPRRAFDEVWAHPECRPLVTAADAPEDVVAATIDALEARLDWGVLLSPAERTRYLEALRGTIAGWTPPQLDARRPVARIELV